MTAVGAFQNVRIWPEAVFPLSDVVRIIAAAADTAVQTLSIGPHVGDAAFHSL